MKFLVAMDSFKGSLTSKELADIVGTYLLDRGHRVKSLSLSDGGEGLLDSLGEALDLDVVEISVLGPLGEERRASYAIKEDRALIEMARLVGLDLVDKKDRNPLNISSYSLGQAILDGLDRGVKTFLIGLGGSVSNDMGLGMLMALGYRFYKEDGSLSGHYGRDLGQIKEIDDSQVDARLKDVKFIVASDVKNPLCGSQGASMVFAGQKGASLEDRRLMDGWFKNLADLVEKTYGIDYRDWPGAGAAGGMGYAFKSFLKADLRPGFQLVSSLLSLEEKIDWADYVITGEGQLNEQSLMGKLPVELASLAKKHGKVSIGLFGAIDMDLGKVNDMGLNACFAISQGPIEEQEAMNKKVAMKNLQACLSQILNLIEL